MNSRTCTPAKPPNSCWYCGCSVVFSVIFTFSRGTQSPTTSMTRSSVSPLPRTLFTPSVSGFMNAAVMLPPTSARAAASATSPSTAGGTLQALLVA